MAEYDFEFIDHTADVGVVARGETLGRAFAGAARGMFEVLADLDGVEERESRAIELESSDREVLLVDFLSELLFLFETEYLLFRRFEVEVSGGRLRVVAYGEKADRARHQIRTGIKAVTYNLLEVVEDEGGYRARVVFDI